MVAPGRVGGMCCGDHKTATAPTQLISQFIQYILSQHRRGSPGRQACTLSSLVVRTLGRDGVRAAADHHVRAKVGVVLHELRHGARGAGAGGRLLLPPRHHLRGPRGRPPPSKLLNARLVRRSAPAAPHTPGHAKVITARCAPRVCLPPMQKMINDSPRHSPRGRCCRRPCRPLPRPAPLRSDVAPTMTLSHNNAGGF